MTLRIARGDTFDYLAEIEVSVRDNNGVLQPVTDLTGWIGAAAIRQRSGRLVADLVFTWVDATQLIAKLTASGGTANWREGPALLNITLTSPGGDVKSTEPAEIVIWTAPTNG